MAPMATVSLAVRGVGALQFFVIKSGVLFTTFKVSDDPFATWGPLQEFIPSPGPVTDIAAGQVSDGRAQLFASTDKGDLITIWKQSTDESAGWVTGESTAA